MKKEEFFKKMDAYGIDLERLSVYVGDFHHWPLAHGIYEKDGKWFYYNVNKKNEMHEKQLTCEREAYDRLYKTVFADLFMDAYITNYIDENTIKVTKETVFRFLKNVYSFSEEQSTVVWNYLKHDMRIFFEFKHFVQTNKFVPDRYCVKVRSHSAEELFSTTSLSVLESYEYLMYLIKNPSEALKNLELKRESIIKEKIF